MRTKVGQCMNLSLLHRLKAGDPLGAEQHVHCYFQNLAEECVKSRIVHHENDKAKAAIKFTAFSLCHSAPLKKASFQKAVTFS
jgi:hypothetical protein